MKISNDPSIHRSREEQMIQHVEKLLADERLRIDTVAGRRSVTGFVRDVARDAPRGNNDDPKTALRRLMSQLNVPDRQLEARMPVGKTLEVTLTRTRWWFLTQTAAKIRVACISPTRDLLLGREPAPISAGDVVKALEAIPPSTVPTTIVLVSTGGFVPEARELAKRQPGRSVILVEPNEAGGWRASGPAELKDVVDLFDPEGDEQKRDRVVALLDENKRDLLTSGIAIDKIAAKSQVPLAMVELIVKEYARQTPGLNAKRLDGRMVLFRESSTLSDPADESGGSMGLIDKMRSILGHKGDTAKKVAFLSERKAALNQKRDRAYEEMGELEQQDVELKNQFKEAATTISKRRITGQLLQLRKDLERRQQTLSLLDKQITVVSTDLHNLELVQHGKSAKLPDSDEITEHAVEAEAMMAELEASAEMAGTAGPSGIAGMTDEEKALYDELERETAADVVFEEEEPEEAAPEPARKEPAAKKAEPRTPEREKAARTPAAREPQAGPAASTPAARRAEPEAG